MRRLSPKLTEISQAVRFCFYLMGDIAEQVDSIPTTATIPSMHIVCLIRFWHRVFHVARARAAESSKRSDFVSTSSLLFFANDRSIFILSFVSFVSFALFGTETVKVDDCHCAILCCGRRGEIAFVYLNIALCNKIWQPFRHGRTIFCKFTSTKKKL